MKDIETLVDGILENTKGNKEMAIVSYGDGDWAFELSNPATSVPICETGGEHYASGESLREVVEKIHKMIVT